MGIRSQKELKTNSLVEGLSEGKTEVVDYLTEKIRPNVMQMALAENGTIEDAKDIFNLVLMETISKIKDKKLEVEKNLEGYLYQACKNKLANLVRDKISHREKLKLYFDKMRRQEPLDPSDQMIKNETQARIQLLFNKLDPKCKEILEMRLSKQKYAEIQAKLGYESLDYLKQKKKKCFQKLKKIFQDDPYLRDFMDNKYFEE